MTTKEKIIERMHHLISIFEQCDDVEFCNSFNQCIDLNDGTIGFLQGTVQFTIGEKVSDMPKNLKEIK